MEHGIKMHSDNTLEITVPSGTKVGRVLVCESGTNNWSQYYSANTIDEFVRTMNMAIKATNLDDEYCLGMRNGFRYAKCVVTGEKPEYEGVEID